MFRIIFLTIYFMFSSSLFAKDGMNALMTAIYEGEMYSALSMVENGAALDERDNLGRTALMIAIKYDQRKVANVLIEKGANIHLTDYENRNVLYYTIRNSESLLSKLFINKGVNVNSEDIRGDTPLIYAAQNYDEYIMDDLLIEGADVHHKNKQGLTAVMISNELKDWSSVQALVSFGANIYSATETTLEWLVSMNEHIADAFIKYVDSSGNDHLINALKKKYFIAAKYFVLGDFDFNRQNIDGQTALMLMVKHNQVELVEHVLSLSGVNINLRDNAGTTALGIAKKEGFKEIEKILLTAGAQE
jgi:ankyrin repeat protein